MFKRAFFVFSLFMTTITFTSCANLSFVSGGKKPFFISVKKESEEFVEVDGSADFYFWGLSPGTSKVDFQDKDQLLGLNLPAYVAVEQSMSWKNFLYTVVTLGLYCPIDYKIKILTAKRQM